MVVKEIEIDGKKIKFAASASITRLYRSKFQRDIILDMEKLSSDLSSFGSKTETDGSSIPVESLEIFENVAYIMAYKANKDIPNTIDEWLDDFNTFSIYLVLPELLDLWQLNNQTFSIPKKK